MISNNRPKVKNYFTSRGRFILMHFVVYWHQVELDIVQDLGDELRLGFIVGMLDELLID